MASSQNRLYFRERGSVRDLQSPDWSIPERHELHVRALGSDKSHLDFSNGDLAAQQDQPRQRLIDTITHLSPEPYWLSKHNALVFNRLSLDMSFWRDFVSL
jgi:hypothetical protein